MIDPNEPYNPKSLFKNRKFSKSVFGSHSSVEVRVNSVSRLKGNCIRCKKDISLKPRAPYCKKCFKSWSIYENDNYKEKYCHICGKKNPSTMIKPACLKCYKVNF